MSPEEREREEFLRAVLLEKAKAKYEGEAEVFVGHEGVPYWVNPKTGNYRKASSG